MHYLYKTLFFNILLISFSLNYFIHCINNLNINRHERINQSIKTVFLLAALFIAPFAHAQIAVESNGNVGIGTSSPSDNIHLYGQTIINPEHWAGGFMFDKSGYYDMPTLRPIKTWYGALGTSTYYFGISYIEHMHSGLLESEGVYCNTLNSNYSYTFSDKNIKNNIEAIENPIEILSKLEGKTYDELPENFGLNKEKDKTEKQNEYGFIAQELMEVLPELTRLDTSTNLYAINYIGIIPILVEAVKEHQTTIEELSTRIEKLEENASLEKSSTIDNSTTTEVETASLDQNIPNPFTQSTKINMFIPSEISNAILYVYNMQGVQINQFDIQERENTFITIEGYSLNAGMYLYTLIADGKEVDTKKMILTK